MMIETAFKQRTESFMWHAVSAFNQNGCKMSSLLFGASSLRHAGVPPCRARRFELCLKINERKTESLHSYCALPGP